MVKFFVIVILGFIIFWTAFDSAESNTKTEYTPYQKQVALYEAKAKQSAVIVLKSQEKHAKLHAQGAEIYEEGERLAEQRISLNNEAEKARNEILLAEKKGVNIFELIGENNLKRIFRGEIPAHSDREARIAKAVETIKKFEGFRSCPYPDAGGYSIGYGSLSSHGAQCISESYASSIIWKESARLDAYVFEKYPNLNTNQHAAIISFTYNTPNTKPAFNRSFVIEALRSKNRARIDEAFAPYGRLKRGMGGLAKRRDAEIDLFFSEQ